MDRGKKTVMDIDPVDSAATVVENQPAQSAQPQPTAASTDDTAANKGRRRTTSEVWKFFTRSRKEGKEIANCKGCGKEYAIGSKDYGTSTLRRHKDICLMLPKQKDIGVMMLDHAGNLKSRQIDHNKVREKIASAIIKHDLPYSFVEYDGIVDLHSYLNPDYRHITRKTAVSDVWSFFHSQKEILKNMMMNSPGRVCLTSDCWTSVTGEGYICLTAHFVDDKWTLNSKILAFSKMDPPHSGVELATRAHEILVDWGIDKKIFSITLDNASANDHMQRLLKERLLLGNSLICNGEFFHVRCCAHILNLIVQEGLKVASSAVNKIRDSIRYVKQSQARMINFKKCVDHVGTIDTSLGLRLDVATRWNSTYAMLESGLRYRRAFSYLSITDSHYHHCPTNVEWARADVMREFLEPFALITTLFSGSSYPTANMYFLQISRIEVMLKAYVDNDDPVIQEMATSMLGKFEKYWSDYSDILSLAIILDPRMKIDVIKFAFSQVDPINCDAKVEHIKSKLYYVFSEYKDVGSSSSASIVGSSSSSSSNVPLLPISTTSNPYPSFSKVDEATYLKCFAEYLKCKSKDLTTIGKSELDYYLEEASLDPNLYVRFNVLDYWKNNSARFPCLARMACDILSIPITTVASESAFSIGSRVLTKYRSSLLPENVQALICTRNWIMGFPWSDGVEEKEEVVDVSIASDIASNLVISS